jgi:hypothetical protein
MATSPEDRRAGSAFEASLQGCLSSPCSRRVRPPARVPVLLALLRVYPNAVRLGARSDTAVRQSVLARSICRDHLLCLAGILGFVALQLSAAARS